jgi:predicted AAA+ superfamily ATPase
MKMPHLRDRLILTKLLKTLTFFPAVAIQGARQTGKSVVARDILPQKLKNSSYLSFDDFNTRREASESPRTFLTARKGASPLIIDEAQMVPEIFNAIKYQVDQKKIPGSYLLLGSTEFSKLARIRESLTGRLGRIRLYPLTLRETHRRVDPFTQEDIQRYLARGGMPGIFSVREEEAVNSLFDDWIDLVVRRDIHEFKTIRLDGDICRETLRLCCELEEPSQAEISKKLHISTRATEKHLNALNELFVLQKLLPHPSGTGKPIFLPLDTGIANHLGAPLLKRLQIWTMNERLAHNAYFETKRSTFYYYRSKAKTMIHLIESRMDGTEIAYQCFEREFIKKTDAVLMNSFLEKNPKAKGMILAPLLEPPERLGVSFIPWANLVLKD